MGYERGRRPHFRLIMNDRDSGASGEIGAAWRSEDTNSIFIKLNPFTSIPVGGNYSITMYPVDDNGDSAAHPVRYDDEDIEKWRQYYNAMHYDDGDDPDEMRKAPRRLDEERPRKRNRHIRQSRRQVKPPKRTKKR